MEISKERSFYDSDYYSQRHTEIDPYLEYVLTRYVLPADKKSLCLDVGCGSGVYVNFIKKKGIITWGIDFSFEAAKISKQMVAEATNLPFKDNTFDLILSVHMLEHLNISEAILFFLECHRVLKNRGKIFIMTPNAMSPGRFILRNKWFPDPSHINIYNPFRLAAHLRQNGFGNICNTFFLSLNKIKKNKSDIVQYYGLGKIFKFFPLFQDLIFFLLFSTPLAFIRDVIYSRAEAVK